LSRKVLNIRLKLRGETDLYTAVAYSNVAGVFVKQRKWSEAEPLSRKALAIAVKELGDEHRLTGQYYNNLAVILIHHHNFTAAESACRKPLVMYLPAYGGDHLEIVQTYLNLGHSLDEQGKLDEAVQSWSAAAGIFERMRGSWSATGLERSMMTVYASPLPTL